MTRKEIAGRYWRKHKPRLQAARETPTQRKWRRDYEAKYRERSYVKEVRRVGNKTWRYGKPRKDLLYKARAHARRLGIACNITEADIIIPARCPILRVRLEASGQLRPSLDRINNAKGYMRGNVRVISWRANVMKGNLSLTYARRIVRYMEGTL